jgi:putative ABC transport system permease protein
VAAAGVAVAVAAVTATLLNAVAIGELVGDADRYGWTFDDVALINFGYGPADLDAVQDDLDRPDVEAWGSAFVTSDLTLDGETVPGIASRDSREQAEDLLDRLPVVDGRLPSGEDELAVGARTADELSLSVGDRVTLASPFGERAATLTGLVVLPDLGPFQSGRTSLATGVLVPDPLLLDVFAGTTESAGVPPADYLDAQSAIVLVDAADGADVDALTADIDDALSRWDANDLSVTYPDPARPPTIVDLASIRGLPSALAGLFAVAMVAAVLAGLAAGVRNRRGELAVVRALGATRRQRRTSVRVHALTTVALGTVVGLPVGVVLARLAFRRLAQDIGVVDDVAVSSLLVVAVAAVALVVALLAAEVLARRAVVRRPIVAAD